MRFLSLALFSLLLCLSCAPKTDTVDDIKTRLIALPDGRQIRAEVLVSPAEMSRGMMYRDPLPQDRGLLFVHDNPAPYRYWMPNVKAPLDIIFMDPARQIVEISANTPPCATEPKACPLYGGHFTEQFVLEMRAGEAQRLGLHQGQTLTF
jgi:uncharacterized membrane protein (UPF0127 family)